MCPDLSDSQTSAWTSCIFNPPKLLLILEAKTNEKNFIDSGSFSSHLAYCC